MKKQAEQQLPPPPSKILGIKSQAERTPSLQQVVGAWRAERNLAACEILIPARVDPVNSPEMILESHQGIDWDAYLPSEKDQKTGDWYYLSRLPRTWRTGHRYLKTENNPHYV